MQLYSSTSYLDDLMLAAAWLAEVTGRPAYTVEAESYWNRILSGSDKSWQSLIPDWNNQWWAGNVILAGLTGNRSYQVMISPESPQKQCLISAVQCAGLVSLAHGFSSESSLHNDMARNCD